MTKPPVAPLRHPRGRGRPPSHLFRDVPLTGAPWLVYSMDKTNVRGGRQGTGLSAQAARSCLDTFGRVGMVRFAASAPTIHTVQEDSACNLYVGLGNDRRQALARFWTRCGRRWLESLEWGHAACGGRQAFVGDGSLLQEQLGVDSHVCPVCMRSQDLYRDDPSARTIPQSSTYQIGGRGFVHAFGCAGSVFRIPMHLLPPYAVVWGPLHCFSNAFGSVLRDTLDHLDNTAPGCGAVWAASFARDTSLRGGRAFDRAVKLSFGEFHQLYLKRHLIPSCGIADLDTFIQSFMDLYGIWHSCGGAEAFISMADLVRAEHVRLFPRMTPSAHNIFDHLGFQWLASGENYFPLIVSDQGPEKAHKPLKVRWLRSMMLTVDRAGFTGLHECIRDEWTTRILSFLSAAIAEVGDDAEAFRRFLLRARST